MSNLINQSRLRIVEGEGGGRQGGRQGGERGEEKRKKSQAELYSL